LGTDVDRREMQTLNLEQVVRVSAPIIQLHVSPS
jgi:hypothetical protein